ncbi:hypothetical protein HBH51_091240 [Parastagonospora nodorum]|nr:hypothetical protein HBH51_091240 [Parastagonospora nodorum]KAH5305847.1 hypothetical protein HBI12_167620 [Parastagonospora nodorum]
MPTEILSPLHFHTLLTSTPYLIADFYATWCPPCKQIAPVYAQLSSTHGSKSFAFVKVNVDEQRELAATHGVSAMPTFVLFKGGKRVGEVRGADVRELKRVVEGVVGELSRGEEGKKGKVEEQKKKKTVVNDDEKRGEEGEEKTVSGSYGMSSNSSWKMSLH